MKFKHDRKRSFVASIILFIFAGIWFSGAGGWYFILQPVTITNTIEYTATIKNIKPVSFYSITTEEHKGKLGIMFEEIVIDMQALNDLSVGQSITFRIKKSELSNFEKEDGGVEIVSLKSGKKEIITLESYNKHSRKMQKQAVAGFFAGGSICLAIAVFFLLWHKEIIGRPKHEIQRSI